MPRSANLLNDALAHYPEPELEYLLDDADRDITVYEPDADDYSTTWLTFRPHEAAVPMEDWR